MIKGDIIKFSNHSWLVLKIKDGRALIITQDIIELRWYLNEFVNITWADCGLRNYLNYEFYNQFNQDEKARIIAVKNNNAYNRWFKTKGGNETTDRLFLLSLQEVCEYFGSSEKLLHKGSQKWLIDDENNQKRQATFRNVYHWWRLRSPGYCRTAASINSKGNIYVRGNGVYGRPRDSGGLRPALWLKT